MKQWIIVYFSSILISCAGQFDETDNAHTDRSERRDDCIFQSSIRGYSVLDESNLLVSASGGRNYHLVLAHRASGLRSGWNIAFNSSTGRVCPGFSEVIFDGHFDDESVRVRTIRELDEAEHEDLLIRWGKKTPEIEHRPAPREVKGAEVEELGPAAGE